MKKDKAKENTKDKTKDNKETETEILNRNLSNPIFVNYNLIKNLEEIKKINYSILELLNIFYQKEISEEKQKGTKEGIFKSK